MVKKNPVKIQEKCSLSISSNGWIDNNVCIKNFLGSF